MANVNELTTAYLEVVFLDRDDAPAAPGTVTFSIETMLLLRLGL